MASIAEPIDTVTRNIQRTRRGWTVADLAFLPDELAGTPVKWELLNGELIPLAPPSDDHGIVGGTLCSELGAQAKTTRAGLVLTEVTIVIDEEEATVLIPNLAFKLREHLAAQRSPNGPLRIVPALVVEIRSPSNRAGYIREKVDCYLAGGARLVWDVDPERRQVTAHRPGEEPIVFNEIDSLTAEGVIPGFALPLNELFCNLDVLPE